MIRSRVIDFGQDGNTGHTQDRDGQPSTPQRRPAGQGQNQATAISSNATPPPTASTADQTQYILSSEKKPADSLQQFQVPIQMSNPGNLQHQGNLFGSNQQFTFHMQQPQGQASGQIRAPYQLFSPQQPQGQQQFQASGQIRALNQHLNLAPQPRPISHAQYHYGQPLDSQQNHPAQYQPGMHFNLQMPSHDQRVPAQLQPTTSAQQAVNPAPSTAVPPQQGDLDFQLDDAYQPEGGSGGCGGCCWQ